jgi:hypothetical protein
LNVNTAIRCAVVNDRVGVFRRRNPGLYGQSLQVEHDDGLVVARRRKSMAGFRRHRRPMRAPNPGDLAQHSSAVFVDHHHAILPADEQAMVRRIRNDVIPAAVTPKHVCVADMIRRGGCLGEERRRGSEDQDEHVLAHESFLLNRGHLEASHPSTLCRRAPPASLS